jgi:hypothetical protein
MLKSGRSGAITYGGGTRAQARSLVREIQRHDTRKAAAAVTGEGDSPIGERPRVRQSTPHGRAPRSSGGRRHASPTRGSPDRLRDTADGDDPPLATCAHRTCGATFEPTSAKQRYCTPACSNAARQGRSKARARALRAEVLKPIDRYRDLVAKHAGELDADDLLHLLTLDVDEARDRLIEAAPKHLRPVVLSLFAEAA